MLTYEQIQRIKQAVREVFTDLHLDDSVCKVYVELYDSRDEPVDSITVVV